MIKLSACIEMLFNNRPFVERIRCAKDAGFDGYEFWSWVGKDLEAIADAQADAGLPLAACAIGTADKARAKAYADGAMLKPQNAGLFTEIVSETIETMKPYGVQTFLVTTGNELEGVCRCAQQDSVVACLSAAAPIAARAGVTLVLEPLNLLVDHAGYYLSRSDQGFEILRAVNHPSIKLLFDIYHQQITEGNLIQNITANIDLIGHFHIADVPGRHQPGTGEINYDHVMRAISTSAYSAYAGCEYTTAGEVEGAKGAELIVSYAHR